MANLYDQFVTGQQATVVPQVQEEDETSSVPVQTGTDSNPYSQFVTPAAATPKPTIDTTQKPNIQPTVADQRTTVALSATQGLEGDVYAPPALAQPQPKRNPYDQFVAPEQRPEAPAAVTPPGGQAIDPEAGRFKTAAGQLATGVGGTYGAMLKGTAAFGADIAGKQIDYATGVLNRISRLDAGEEMAEEEVYSDQYLASYDDARRRGNTQMMENIKNTLMKQTQVERDPREYGLYKAGEVVADVSSNLIAVNPEYREEFFAGKVPQGFGSMIAFMSGAILSGPSGVALMGMAVNGADGFEDAINEGASLEDAMKSFELTGLVGASEALPIASILNRLDKGTGGSVKRMFLDMLKSGTEEGIQELAQSLFQNLVASDIVEYDPDRDMWTGETTEGAAVGFTTGALITFLGNIVAGRRGRIARKQDAEAPPPEFDPDTGQPVVPPEEQPRMAAEDIIGVDEEAPTDIRPPELKVREPLKPVSPEQAPAMEVLREDIEAGVKPPEPSPIGEVRGKERRVEKIAKRERAEERRVAEAERRVADEPFLEERRVSEEERRAPVKLKAKQVVVPEKTLGDYIEDLSQEEQEISGPAFEELRSRLVPAIKTDTGEILKGKVGQGHADLSESFTEVDEMKMVNAGFYDSITDNFYSSEETSLDATDLMTDMQRQRWADKHAVGWVGVPKQTIVDLVAKESRVTPVEAEVERKERAGGEKSLKGMPDKQQEFGGLYHAPGPSKVVRDSARAYMKSRGDKYSPPTDYAKVDPAAATAVAKAYEALPEFDDEAAVKAQPNYHEVKVAYEAMAKETRAQFDHVIKETGLKIDFVKDTESDEYRDSPRRAIDDINENNHLWIYSTRSGFGETKLKKLPSWHPLLQETDITISGEKALVNDLFRIVHDYYGHAKEGVGFRASGEFNAWRQHSSMYSPEARRAMTTELRGQNSWTNYGPKGAANRKASVEDTVFPKERMGLLPEWANDPTRAYDEAAKVEVTQRKLREKAPTKRVKKVPQYKTTLEQKRKARVAKQAIERLNSVYEGSPLKFKGADPVKSGFMSEEEVSKLNELADILNKDIVYVNSASAMAKAVEGTVLVPSVPGIQQVKTIYINVGALGTRTSPMRIFGHELVHHLRNDHADLYKQLSDIVKTKNANLSRHVQVNVGYKMDADRVTEELIADFIGDNFEDPNFWNDVVSYNPSLGVRLLEIITKWIDMMKARIKKPGVLGHEEFIVNLNDMRETGAKVIAEYADRQQSIVQGYGKYYDVVVRESVRPKTIMEFWAAKGGLNREEAEAQGIDPDDFTKRYKGKYLFPKTGGMTFDQAAEAAREQGEDVYGPNEVLDIMYDHLRGVTLTEEEVEQDYAGLEAADRAREEDVSIHKIFKTGRWVGAPDFVKSGKDLAKMRAVLRQLASEGEARRFWYEESGKAVLNYFGNVEDATKFAKVIAVYSAHQQVGGNTTQALKAWFQYKSGKPIKVGMARTDKNASDQMYKNKDWTGLKTNAFYQNMMFGIDPSQAEDMVTIDMWMMGSMNFHTQNPGEQQYRFVEREVRRLSSEMGWEPHQVQASIWSSYRARAVEAADDVRTFAGRDKIEQGSPEWFHLQHKLAMEESVTPAQVAKGGYNFADALHDRTVHMTADVAPGYRTGILPNFASLKLNMQTEYMNEVNAVENGEIARMLDLPEGILTEGYYASNSDVGVAGNLFVPMATEPEVIEGKKSPGPRKVSEEMRAKIKKYIAMRGYVFSQEEVLWHYPRYDAAKSKHDGVDVETARPLDAYETRILYDALKSHFNSPWLAPGGLESGARIINITLDPETKVPLFEQISVKDFQDGVKEVIGALPHDFGGGVVTTRGFERDGSYINNNWEKNKKGEIFKKKIDNNDLPALDKMRNRIKLINEKYSNMPEVKRMDDLVAKQSVVVNFPVSGKASDKPGTLNSVRVLYYGDRSTHAVTGSRSGVRAEDKRTRGHPVLENRINMHTKPQKFMPGKIPHKAVVHNIYNGDQDVQELMKAARQKSGDGQERLNTFELMVLQSGFDGYKSKDRVVLLGQRVLEVQPSDDSAFADPTYEVKYSVTPKQQKKMPDPLDFMDALKEGRPVEAILRAMFKYTGIRWVTRGAYNQLKKTIVDRKFKDAPPGSYREWFNNGLERFRIGIIDRHGIPQAHLDASDQQKMSEREIAMKGADIVAELIKSGTVAGTAESEILQGVLSGETIADEHWAKVSAPIRKAIDELGQAAVEYGLISQDSYERNRLTYLHRVYKKHEDVGLVSRGIRRIFSARRKSLIGSALRGRGMWVEISAAKMLENTETAYNVTVNKGDKLIMYSKFSNLERPGNVWKRPKVLKRVLIPAGRDIDMSSYERDPTWVNSGEWEIRDTSKKKGKEFTLWRDHTKEERTRMGEILDAKYTILKTFHSMAHDLSTGQMFSEIAGNADLTWQGDGEPDEGTVTEPSGFGWSTYVGVDWVRVPSVKIKDTGGKYKYGKLAGKYVRGGVWRDLADMDKMASPGLWRTLMTQWKLNKTARNPVVHMNNIMANVALMDMADVRGRDLYRAFKAMLDRDNPEGDWRAAEIAGAFDNSFVLEEIKKNRMDPMLREMLGNVTKESEKDATSVIGVANTLHNMFTTMHKHMAKFDQWAVEKYQMEDMVFRMALFMRRRAQGIEPLIAAREARDQFINYDIKAPWINMMRRTVLPFLSYTYRAVPMVANTIANRPHKIFKYAAIMYLANYLGYALDDEGGDEEDERSVLRDMDNGITWAMTPKLVRMAWRDSYGNPVFLDMKRWLPAADIFDTGQSWIPQPFQWSGPLQLGFELMMNRSMYFDREIYDKDTANLKDKASALSWHAYRSWVPSAPWIPGSWYMTKIGKAVLGFSDSQGRQYSTNQALLNSIGIKLKPLDVKRRKFQEVTRLTHELRSLTSDIYYLERDRLRAPESGIVSNVTDWWYDKERAALDRKIEDVSERLKKMGLVGTR